jgi:Flp pilus assembly protein TadD
MKKIVSIVLALILFVGITNAQKIEDGRKYLSFQKNKSALNVFQSIYNSNTKNAEAIYWYGQALLANDNIADAKSLYQKALQDGVNEPLIWIGAAHVELAENGDLNSAKQKFEQAITASTPTKGKRKNKPDTEILNAIGRANAYGSSKIGDPNYGIEKLSLAIQNDENANAEVYINLGKCYQKLGGENGGEAVKAYTTAIAKNPAYAEAHWRIGLIYASQDNKEMYEKYYNDAIAANAEFPPVYLSYYRVYEQTNVNIAKEYLDKYVQYADKDCGTDYFYADYLFRAGKYQESLEKAKAMSTSNDCKSYKRLPVLFAYNYDRLGDSIQSKEYILGYLNAASSEDIENTDYELAVKVLSKFSGLEMDAANYLQKAIDKETKQENKLKYMKMAADMFAKANMYAQQVIWLQKYNDLKGSMGEYDHYIITNAAYFSQDYVKTMAYAQKYITAFPEKPQGYAFNVRAAKALDTTTNPGIAENALLQQNEFYAKDTATNKRYIVANYYYIMIYYADKVKDYVKALEYCNKILALIPEDQEMLNIHKVLDERAKKQVK